MPKSAYYYNNLQVEHPEAANWLGEIPKDKWTIAFSSRQCWGHMTINLVVHEQCAKKSKESSYFFDGQCDV